MAVIEVRDLGAVGSGVAWPHPVQPATMPVWGLIAGTVAARSVR